ncbi:MAG: hypothetical protein HYX47_10375 [Burkholderiales bacterium]|nr:hypothetical protein [Burkholderiales bacterium]
MGNAITPDSRALWLMLARNGNWWTVKTLVHHWRPTFTAVELDDLLRPLVGHGYVMVRDKSAAEPTYAVTSDCFALPGYERVGMHWREAA